MFRKMLLTFINFSLIFFIFFKHQFKINVYGSINFDEKIISQNQTISPKDLFFLFKKIFFSKMVEKACFLFKNTYEIDIFLFEKIPYANLFIKGKCFLVDKNGFTIKEEIDVSKICVFLEESISFESIKKHLSKKIMRNADSLIISDLKYQLYLKGSSLIYYDLNQIDIFYNKLSTEIFLNKNFVAEFYPNNRFSLFFFKKKY